MTTSYIFGYGSLISDEARTATGKTSTPCPVYVQNLSRIWSAFPGSYYCPLGMEVKEGATAGGVLFKILPEYQKDFDARERQYIRTFVPSESIRFLRESLPLHDETIEVYVPPEILSPNPECPLIQSYIDVCITGCLQYSEEFARHFIASTKNWNVPWVNDRDTPLYSRRIPAPSKSIYQRIDALLSESKEVDLSRRIALTDYEVDVVRQAKTYE